MDNKKRTLIQFAASLIQNANFKGFFSGEIYKGSAKNVCVPGLNCYSCPGALGSCPIGSLQNTLSSYKFKFPYYVLGLLIFFGVLLGRAVCGFLCPFGFLQDLLNNVPFPKKIKTFKADKYLRIIKYIVLAVMVIILPVFVKLTPFFCKYICPSGTLSGILLSFSDTKLYQFFGSTFIWKICVLSITIILSIIIARPFCKYLCPLGAFYALFNKISVVQMDVDKSKCTGCSKCQNVCPMAVNPSKNANSTECIRCGKCMNECPEKAVSYKNLFKNK